MTNDAIKKAKSKISKLLGLGTSMNESEAMAAMKKAHELMAEWALSIEDIEIGTKHDVVIDVIETGRRQRPEILSCAHYIAQLTSVKYWSLRPSKWDKSATFKINVAGYETDVELFKFFWKVINHAFQVGLEEYKNSEEYAKSNFHGRALRKSFAEGFVDGVSVKVEEIIKENGTMRTKTGTEIVPVKMANIEDHMQDMGIKLRIVPVNSRVSTYAGHKKGYQKGSNVSFNRPVNGGQGVKAIA